MTKISILGSTGSIGTAALDVVSHLKNFKVVSLSANKNISLLKKQARKFRPARIAVGPEELKDESLIADADIVLIAVVGSSGIWPLINSIKAGKKIALANKESLVISGGLVKKMASRYGARILPVDSEHSAVFQCLDGRDANDVSKIILTASGGPFRSYPRKKLAGVKIKDVLNHPTWSMGRKITVDSATLINKGFEVIEAHYLFDMPYEKIEVLIHPQSVIHGAVEFSDGSVIAQMGVADMRIPIQYALTYPERKKSPVKKLDLASINKLEFFRPDTGKFPCFGLALAAARAGGSMPVVLNAANEVAVKKFLEGRLRFTDIPVIIEKAMAWHSVLRNPDIEDILELDTQTRKYAEDISLG